ncbi:MAG: chorismate mutase [Natronohydrobacter sp.]|nr:chorismate mutase [Natronohydrobacter sp.]
MRPPSECRNMDELRAQIDRLDQELVRLLVARAGYIDRAIDLKTSAQLPARIEARVEEVLQNVRILAAQQGLDPDLAGALWERIIEWSIAREERILGPGTEGKTR